MDTKLVIRKIPPEATYPLRATVLRSWPADRPCPFLNDDAEDSFHLAACIEEHTVAVASFYRQTFEPQPQLLAFQLRGMATAAAHRGRGAAAAVLLQGLSMCRDAAAQILWCNARVAASGFYRKMDFELASGIFQIPGIGPHYLMSKRLD